MNEIDFNEISTPPKNKPTTSQQSVQKLKLFQEDSIENYSTENSTSYSSSKRRSSAANILKNKNIEKSQLYTVNEEAETIYVPKEKNNFEEFYIRNNIIKIEYLKSFIPLKFMTLYLKKYCLNSVKMFLADQINKTVNFFIICIREMNTDKEEIAKLCYSEDYSFKSFLEQELFIFVCYKNSIPIIKFSSKKYYCYNIFGNGNSYLEVDILISNESKNILLTIANCNFSSKSDFNNFLSKQIVIKKEFDNLDSYLCLFKNLSVSVQTRKFQFSNCLKIHKGVGEVILLAGINNSCLLKKTNELQNCFHLDFDFISIKKVISNDLKFINSSKYNIKSEDTYFKGNKNDLFLEGRSCCIF